METQNAEYRPYGTIPNSEPIAWISLRDWFAGQAAMSLVGLTYSADQFERKVWPPKQVATHAYAVADAMLIERAK